MFDRWLRRFKGNGLDLTRHQPSDFVGKIVVLNEREYVIGANERTDDQQGYMHRLINRVSGLCLHMIQIRPEYQSAPDTAWAASREKQAATALLRDADRAEGRPDVICPLTARQGCGSSFELHEVPWGMFGHETPTAAEEAIVAANELKHKRDYQGAIAIFERLVAEHPNHTVALNNLASCHLELGQSVEALDLISRVVEIEPNYSKYRGSHLVIGAHCAARRHAAALYDDLKGAFPHVGDYDFYGVHAYLRIGEPERAREILLRAKLPRADAESLGATVEKAVQARSRYDALRSQLSAKENHFPQEEQEELLSFLEAAHAAYEDDPDIQASLGFRLRAAGGYKRASELLLVASCGIGNPCDVVCRANAAYCALMSGDWPRAMHLLEHTMSLIESRGMANPVDIPGIVEWISDQSAVIETMKPSAAEVLNRALLECPDKSLITPAIEKMAALLRQFAAQYRGAVHK
jgi:tetratricopeptide (TPR) repeat protein